MRFFTCRRIRPRLPLLAGDDLIGPARRQVERHLIGCPDCRHRLASLRGALEALHAASAIDPFPAPAPLWPDLAREIREARRPAPSVWSRLLVVPAAAAVAAAVMLAIGSSWSPNPVAPRTRPPRASRTLLTNSPPRATAPRPSDVDTPPRLTPAAAPNPRRRLDSPEYAVGIPPKVRRPSNTDPRRVPRPTPTLH